MTCRSSSKQRSLKIIYQPSQHGIVLYMQGSWEVHCLDGPCMVLNIGMLTVILKVSSWGLVPGLRRLESVWIHRADGRTSTEEFKCSFYLSLISSHSTSLHLSQINMNILHRLKRFPLPPPRSPQTHITTQDSFYPGDRSPAGQPQSQTVPLCPAGGRTQEREWPCFFSSTKSFQYRVGRGHFLTAWR